jgi:23S rRNA-/tRNA-specific pseudouridylate synthase
MTHGSGGPTILARGEDHLFAWKPVGLATTGRTLDDPDCLQSELMAHLNRRKVWAVHQLDKGTSGVCLFALRKPSVPLWVERLRRGNKLYLGVCSGRLTGRHSVRAPIGQIRRSDGRTQAAVVSDGKPAHSTITALQSVDDRTLFTAQIHTGRTHQIRLHMGHLGHPLVGEKLHRTPACDEWPFPALHSWCLELSDSDSELLRIEAPLPDALFDRLKRWGFDVPDSDEVGFWRGDE